MNKWMVAVVTVALVGGATNALAGPEDVHAAETDKFTAKISIQSDCDFEMEERLLGLETTCNKRNAYEIVFGGAATAVIGAHPNSTDRLRFVVEAYEDNSDRWDAGGYFPANFPNCQFIVQASDGSSYSIDSFRIVKTFSCADAPVGGANSTTGVYHNDICDDKAGPDYKDEGCHRSFRGRGLYAFDLQIKDVVDLFQPLTEEDGNPYPLFASGVQGQIFDVFFCPNATGDDGTPYACVHYYSPRSKTLEDPNDDNPECAAHPALAGYEDYGVGQCGTLEFPFSRYVSDHVDDDATADAPECAVIGASPYVVSGTAPEPAGTLIRDGNYDDAAYGYTSQCPDTIHSPLFTPIVVVERDFQGGITGQLTEGEY